MVEWLNDLRTLSAPRSIHTPVAKDASKVMPNNPQFTPLHSTHLPLTFEYPSSHAAHRNEPGVWCGPQCAPSWLVSAEQFSESWHWWIPSHGIRTTSVSDNLWIQRPSSGHMKLLPTGPPGHASRTSIPLPSDTARSSSLIVARSASHVLQSVLTWGPVA